MVVWISGPTGSGKSSLAQAFRAVGYRVVDERLPEELYRAFAGDPIRYCAPLQEEIMRSRYKASLGFSGDSRVVFDRSIDEDIEVFCRMHHELGLLNDQQYGRLRVLARELQTVMPRPDLILFLCPDPRALTARVNEESQPAIIVRNLERQVSLYHEWVRTRDEDVLRIDNSACQLDTVERLFSGCDRC